MINFNSFRKRRVNEGMTQNTIIVGGVDRDDEKIHSYPFLQYYAACKET